MQSQQSGKSFIPKCSCTYDEVGACVKGKNLTGNDLQSMVNGVRDCYSAKCGRDDISRMENACFVELSKDPNIKKMPILEQEKAVLSCMANKLKKTN